MQTVNDILEMAMTKESEAANFYRDLASKTSRLEMRELLETFAREEEGHQARLMKLKDQDWRECLHIPTHHLGLAEYLIEVKPSTNLDYAEMLIMAMGMERAAYGLYSTMARVASGPAQMVLLQLAEEESTHCRRFETEYESYVHREN